jgi:hypothetical protein
VDASAAQENGNGDNAVEVDSNDGEMEQEAIARLLEDVDALLTAAAEHLDELRYGALCQLKGSVASIRPPLTLLDQVSCNKVATKVRKARCRCVEGLEAWPHR